MSKLVFLLWHLSKMYHLFSTFLKHVFQAQCACLSFYVILALSILLLLIQLFLEDAGNFEGEGGIVPLINKTSQIF